MDYHLEIGKRAAQENAPRLRQFGLRSLDSLPPEELRTLGVTTDCLFTYGVTAITSLEAWKASDTATLLAIKASRPHLGYLQVINLTRALTRALGNQLFITLGTFDHLLSQKSRSEIAQLSDRASRIIQRYVDDFDPVWITEDKCSDWYWWCVRVANLIPSSKASQLLGSDAAVSVLHQWLIPSMVTALLSPQFFHNGPKPTLVPCGNTELPFLAISREIAPKLGFVPPIGILLSSIPNTVGSDRMAGKNSATAVFLDDALEVVAQKLKKTATGGRPKAEHAIHGGDYQNCSFLRLASITLNRSEIVSAVDACINGNPCSACKSHIIPRLARAFRDCS
jgi:hypothetical protein